jgi:hypothetical protein
MSEKATITRKSFSRQPDPLSLAPQPGHVLADFETTCAHESHIVIFPGANTGPPAFSMAPHFGHALNDAATMFLHALQIVIFKATDISF